jgi:copper chaperone CopZ/predicted peroxiredoxin
MSKTMSCVVVGVVAFLAGGFAFQLIGRGSDGSDKSHAAGRQSADGADTTRPRQFAIKGMTCQGCVATVTAALEEVPGVQSAMVSLEDGRAVVVASEADVSTERILAAINATGYHGQLAADATRASTAATPPSQATASKQPILVNITRGKNELHAVSMALGLAQSALGDGRAATVFLNVDAPVFAAKELAEDVQFADFPPIRKMLADFVAQGGRLVVCGHCAHVVKIDPQAMLDGAKVAGHGELFATMAPGTIVFSY